MLIAHLLAQLTRCQTIAQCLGRLWHRLISIRPLADIEPCANRSPFPHGASVLDRDAQRRAYIAAIKEINIPQLASSYNLGKEWVAVGYPDHGSFNFCVFVVFPHDGTKWIVWFPICPLLHEPWRKLQSEIATFEGV